MMGILKIHFKKLCRLILILQKFPKFVKMAIFGDFCQMSDIFRQFCGYVLGIFKISEIKMLLITGS